MKGGLCLCLAGAILSAGISAASAQDAGKIPVTQPIESWYRLMSGDKHIGFAHELLLPVEQRDYAYDYEFELQAEVKEPREGLVVTASHYFSARVNHSFMAESFQANLSVADLMIPYDMQYTPSGRQVSARYPTGDVGTFALAEGEETQFHFFLASYWMRQGDQLDKPGQRRLSIFHPQREKAVSNTQEIRVEVVETTRRKVMDKEVPVTLLRIQDLPSAAKELAFIECSVDRYGRVVEMTGPGSRLELVASRQKAVGEMKVVHQRGRRDPFRKDLVLTKKGKEARRETGPHKDGPRLSREQIPEALLKIRKAIQELEVLAQDPARRAETRAAYKKILDDILEAMAVADPEDPRTRKEIEDVRLLLEKAFPGADEVLEEARRIYIAAVEVDARADDLKAMEEKEKQLRVMLTRPEFKPPMPQENVAKLKHFIDGLEKEKSKVKDRLDLAKKKLVYFGAVIGATGVEEPVEIPLTLGGHSMRLSEIVTMIHSTQMAVVNGKYYRAGDVIEGDGVPVEVLEIRSFYIKVKYKDQVREQPIKE